MFCFFFFFKFFTTSTENTCCCSVTHSCSTLCNHMDCSMLGLPVPHRLPKFAQVYVRHISDAIQPYDLLVPSSLPSIFPSTRDFTSESALDIGWPNDWSFSFNTSPSNKCLGFISLKNDWFDLLAVQGTLRSPTVRKHQFLGAPPSL